MAKELRTSICLFRNDLRVHDNETLLWAHRNSDHVVPLYCFDPDHFKGTWHFNFAKTGVHRAKFTLQSVHNLRNNLQKMNSNLVVHHSHPLQGTMLSLLQFSNNIGTYLPNSFQVLNRLSNFVAKNPAQ